MPARSPFRLALASLALLLFVGCGGQNQEFQEYSESEKAAPEEHDHAHEHGPHDGHVLELGEHEYHAEVVLDKETKKVTVYLYGHDLDESLAIDAKEITLSVEVDGKGTPIALTAAPQEGDPEGKSSRFEAADNETIKQHVHDIEELHGRLVVPIEGKSYSVELSHDHDHDHDH